MNVSTHITVIDRDWVAAANTQDQAEADATQGIARKESEHNGK